MPLTNYLSSHFLRSTMMKFCPLALITTLLAAAAAVNGKEQENDAFDWEPYITTTWANKRYAIQGQCDLVMLQDAKFAEGLGIDIHIRTKIAGVRSYIKSVGIKIGDDVLEIEGSPNPRDEDALYWFNNEYQAKLANMAGFPVMMTKPRPYKQQYNIDLDSKYPGKDITIEVFNEFIRFKLNGDESVFGKTVGLLGDYKTGKTLARDGASELHDFVQLNDEWQVLPGEPRLFHQVAHPQFPHNCIRQEYPSETKSMISEPRVSVEEAEKSCSSVLDDATLIKECISYVMAGRDSDVVGDFLLLKDYHPELLL
mmetsp:Transcript_46246/g.112083  ORF Transcript_46246/g.112083 Transcript_46246/m.112083 type:complete len:312 (+) Transcript_46246:839-1774(+)